jgi:hypothetical protein
MKNLLSMFIPDMVSYKLKKQKGIMKTKIATKHDRKLKKQMYLRR